MIRTTGRLQIGFALLVLILLIGTVGYEYFEPTLTPLKAFYSAVLVVSTLGFGDFTPETTGGIWLTIGLIFSGVGTLYYLLGSFAEALIETSLGTQRQRRMERQIARMRNHYIVCGFGRVGRYAAQELAAERQALVIIDNDESALEQARTSGYPVLLGDATEDAVLRRAGVQRARGLLVTTASDAANVFITLTARAFNRDLLIVARASIESSESKLLKAGATRVIAPELVGGQRMATLVLRPEAPEMRDPSTPLHSAEHWLDEVLIVPSSPLSGQTLASAQIFTQTGATIIAVRHADGRIVASPTGEELLAPGDVLVSIGSHEQLRQLERFAQRGTQEEPH
jgi:voltage-gated potassium channel